MCHGIKCYYRHICQALNYTPLDLFLMTLGHLITPEKKIRKGEKKNVSLTSVKGGNELALNRD